MIILHKLRKLSMGNVIFFNFSIRRKAHILFSNFVDFFFTQVHSLNVMRALFRDSRLSEDVYPYIAQAMMAALNGYASNFWAVSILEIHDPSLTLSNYPVSLNPAPNCCFVSFSNILIRHSPWFSLRQSKRVNYLIYFSRLSSALSH